MVTLTLNKPKKIGNQPLYEFAGQYVVMRHSRNENSFRFSISHKSREFAIKEAKRLAKLSSSERFLVLQIVDSVDWEA